MKIINTTACESSCFNFSFLDLSKLCNNAIPKRSSSGEFLPKVFKTAKKTRYSQHLNQEWYKISMYFRAQTRFSFIYDTLPYVLQSLKIHPKTLGNYIDPIIFIKSVHDEIVGTGTPLITPNFLVKFLVTFIRILIRKHVKKKAPTKTMEELDDLANYHLEKISPLLLPSTVLPIISFLGGCYIPSQSEILAHLERSDEE